MTNRKYWKAALMSAAVSRLDTAYHCIISLTVWFLHRRVRDQARERQRMTRKFAPRSPRNMSSVMKRRRKKTNNSLFFLSCHCIISDHPIWPINSHSLFCIFSKDPCVREFVCLCCVQQRWEIKTWFLYVTKDSQGWFLCMNHTVEIMKHNAESSYKTKRRLMG